MGTGGGKKGRGGKGRGQFPRHGRALEDRPDAIRLSAGVQPAGWMDASYDVSSDVIACIGIL